MAPDGADSGSNTVYCTSCGEEISAATNFCPECGTEQGSETVEEGKAAPETTDEKKSGMRHQLPGISTKNTTRRNVLVGTGYTILGLGVLGAVAGPQEDSGTSGGSNGGTSGGSNEGTPTATEATYPNAFYYDTKTGILIKEGVSAELDSLGNLYIRGTAVNESENDYSYVQLSWAIYDSSGAKIADGLANTSGLPAGQSWRFEALATGAENVDSYSLTDITAY